MLGGLRRVEGERQHVGGAVTPAERRIQRRAFPVVDEAHADLGVATTRGFLRSAFGHFGFGGSGGWADPKRKLAVALIVNSGMGTPFGDMRIIRIGGAALSSAERRIRRSRAGEEAAQSGAPARASTRSRSVRGSISLVR